MRPLVIRIVSCPAATLVTICGEVDIATIAQLRERLDAVPDRDTVLEMSQVMLLCAAGVRAVLGLQDRLATGGARLVLAAASRPVQRVLTLFGLGTDLVLTPTVEHALTWLQNRRPKQPVSAREPWSARSGCTADAGLVACGTRESLSRELLSSTAPGAAADEPVERCDGEWSRDADQRSASLTTCGAVEPAVVRSRLTQEAAVILRAEAAAVAQAAAELTTHAAALRDQAQAKRERGHTRRARSPPPAGTACDMPGEQPGAAPDVHREQVTAAGCATTELSQDPAREAG